MSKSVLQNCYLCAVAGFDGGLGSRRYGDTRVATLRGVELLVLDHKQLDHLARNHPELIRRFEEVAHVREEKICQLLVSDLAEWVLWIFDVVSETTQNAQYVSGRGVMSDSPLLPQTSSGHGKDIAVPRREFEDMFKSVGEELYDDRVALDLLSRLRAWSKAEGPGETGALSARTDSPTDFMRRTEVQEWLSELSDSDFFTTAHYCRLRSKQLEEIHTPQNATSNAWRKLRNAQKVMATEPAAAPATTDSTATDNARSMHDVMLDTIRSDIVEMKAMAQRVRRHALEICASGPTPLTCADVCSWRRWRVRKKSLPPRWRRSLRGWQI